MPSDVTRHIPALLVLLSSFGNGHSSSCRRPDDQVTFDREAGSGYLAQKAASMTDICVGADSWLKCTESLEFCIGRNLQIEFPNTIGGAKKRYNTEVLASGGFKGHCTVKNGALKRFMKRGTTLHPLQSWAPEIRYLEQASKDTKSCDHVVNKPTILMKPDLTSNMYHHFCDFFNLYASLALNGTVFSQDKTLTMPPSLKKGDGSDTNILVWESVPYTSPFSPVMRAFTKNDVTNLQTFAGQRVCFEGSLMFPLLPRMTKGLYYNTPLTENGCSNSTLFKDFSTFVTTKFGLEVKTRPPPVVRVTILDREDHKFRRILNLGDLVEAAMTSMDGGGPFEYEVRVVRFAGKPFEDQLKIVGQTDVLVGVHGAGLTHLMFLPTGGVLLELEDCGDACYRNLARLNGVAYVTLPAGASQAVPLEEPGGGDVSRPKFVNFVFHPEHFVQTLEEAAKMALRGRVGTESI